MIGSFYLQRPLLLISAFSALSGLLILWKASDREGYVLGVTRTLFFLLLAVPLAGPFVQDVRTVSDQQDLYVLEDNSRSAELVQGIDLQKENVNVERRTILRGNNSRLASALDSELRSDSQYLLISDGRTQEDLEGVLEKYRNENSSISVLKPEMSDERAVRVSGPSTTVPGAATRFTVHVSSTTAGEVPVTVSLDNSTVFDGEISGSWSFNRSFSDEETHRIEARIETDDRYDGNDRYYKTVTVREKPDVLFVGQESELTKKISEFYDIEIVQQLPEDLSDYYSVISSEALNSEEVGSYISRGNGYMYLGGYESPARYLPLDKSDEDFDSESTRVVMAMESSSYDQSPTLRDSKQAAIGIVDALPSNTKFAGLYYAQEVYPFLDSGEELLTLYRNKEKIVNNIKRFERKPEKRHEKALKKAGQMLGNEGNIILLTNGDLFGGSIGGKYGGKTKEQTRRDALVAAKNLPPDIDLYIIGTGKITYEREKFLKELVERAPGPRSRYYTSDNLKDLAEIELGAGGGTSAFKPLAVIDREHFITRDMGLDSSVSLFDEVRPKRSSDVLVSGPGKREFLTTWNYGLGRVAAFSGGQPTLSRVLSSDPGLVSRSASWTVGDPNRKQEEWLEISEKEAPGEVEVTASYPAEGLTYSSEDRYTGSVDQEGLGFQNFSGRIYAYNYNSEIGEVGYRDGRLDRIASSTGGEVYSPREFREKGFEVSGEEQVSHSRPLAAYFLAAALVVFLAEVGYRKLNGKK